MGVSHCRYQRLSPRSCEIVIVIVNLRGDEAVVEIVVCVVEDSVELYLEHIGVVEGFLQIQVECWIDLFVDPAV